MSIVTFPEGAEVWGDLVKSLCCKEPEKRLAMKRGGVKNIEFHDWFSDPGNGMQPFNWQDLNMRTMRPPYVPNLSSDEDVSNFAADQAEPPYVPAGHAGLSGSDWDAGFEDRVGPILRENRAANHRARRASEKALLSSQYRAKVATWVTEKPNRMEA